LESSGARIEQLARQMITRGRPIPLDELVARVDAVTVESARAAGRALISRGKLATAVLGLGSALESAAAIAETLTRRPSSGPANFPLGFFRTINFSDPLPPSEGNGVMWRTPQIADFEEWAALRETSRDFLTPWEPTWPVDDLTRAAFRRRVKRYAEDLRTDQGYAFLITRSSDGSLAGGLTFAKIR